MQDQLSKGLSFVLLGMPWIRCYKPIKTYMSSFIINNVRFMCFYGFTWFYMVLDGFTWFYHVLPSFCLTVVVSDPEMAMGYMASKNPL